MTCHSHLSNMKESETFTHTLQFSGSLYPTSNLYFPQIFGIHLKLVEEMKSPDPYMEKIATQMWTKFNKYWADFNLLLAIAVVFDPCFKFSLVEFSYKKLYGEDSSQLKLVKDALFALFDEYMQASKSSTTSTSVNSSNGNVEEGDHSDDSIFEVRLNKVNCKYTCRTPPSGHWRKTPVGGDVTNDMIYTDNQPRYNIIVK